MDVNISMVILYILAPIFLCIMSVLIFVVKWYKKKQKAKKERFEPMDNKSKTSKAQQRAAEKYKKAHYDRISIYFPAGHREKLQALSAQTGESVNALINRAVNTLIDQETSPESSADDPQ